HFAVIGAGFHQDIQPVSLRILADGALLDQVRRPHRLAAQLPVPIVGILPQRLVSAVKGSALQKFSESSQETSGCLYGISTGDVPQSEIESRRLRIHFVAMRDRMIFRSQALIRE